VFKSPGDGLPPYELERVLGTVLRRPVLEDDTLTFELLEELPQPELTQPSGVLSGHDG
jgi:hypothetical protein